MRYSNFVMNVIPGQGD
uniref:Uncharacterized protein n=1 Tax=Anguilla anguilla TaxID=7936 RepID=A0A0E9WIC9_ANGAN